MTLEVLFQDTELLIITKPSGLPSVPLLSQPDDKNNATDEVLKIDPNALLLNRIDTGTSGILVFARTPIAFTKYKSLWKTDKIKKFYRAIVSQNLKHAPAKKITDYKLPQKFKLQMGHDIKTKKRMRMIRNDHDLKKIRGKPLPAITLLHRVDALKNKIFDLELQIETGVRHQIRCTLYELGYPILGDVRYQGASGDRLWLHASRIEITRDSGRVTIVEAPLPKNWPSF